MLASPSPSVDVAAPGRRDGLAAYFGAAFALTWALHLSITLLHLRFGPELSSPGELAYVAGIAMPCVAAVAVAASRGGAAGVRALLAPFFRVRFPLWYWAVVVGLVGAIRALGRALAIGAGGAAPEPFLRPGVGASAILVLAAMQLWVMAGEEVGWRGFALPRLAARFGPAGAALVLGAIWAAWHLPMFLVPGSSQHGSSFASYLLLVECWSAIMTWLWTRTGSPLAPMVFHGALNVWSSATALPTGASPWVLAVYCAVALAALAALARAPRPAPAPGRP